MAKEQYDINFDDLKADEIRLIAREEFQPEHKLVLRNSKNYIVTDISDVLEYGDISNQIVHIESADELRKFFDDNDGLEIDEKLKEDLISQAEENYNDGDFYLGIKDNYDNASDFHIAKSLNEALCLVDDKAYAFIEDEDEIINNHSEQYLKSGFMQNNYKYNERTVLNNYFNLEDLVSKYAEDIILLRTISNDDVINEVREEFNKSYHFVDDGEDLSSPLKFIPNPNFTRSLEDTIILAKKVEAIKEYYSIIDLDLHHINEDYLNFEVFNTKNDSLKFYSEFLEKNISVSKETIKDFKVANVSGTSFLYNKEELKNYLDLKIKSKNDKYDLKSKNLESKYNKFYDFADCYIYPKNYSTYSENPETAEQIPFEIASSLKKDFGKLEEEFEEYIPHYNRRIITSFGNYELEKYDFAEEPYTSKDVTTEAKEDALTNLVSEHQKHLMKQADDVQNYNSNTVVNEDYKQREIRRDR